MTCGIYLLGFTGTHKVYVGQSLNIEERFKKHIKKLVNKDHSINMNMAYKEFGLPEIEILEECLEEKLNELENYHINLWNAVDDGFNTLYHAEDSPNKRGEEHGMSKYTNEQIKKVFFLLVEQSEIPFKEIAGLTGVSFDTVCQISIGTVHLWLKKEFPVEYAKLEKLIGHRDNHTSAKYKGIQYPLLIDPIGNTYNIENIRQFAKEHGINQGHLGQVLRGKEKAHKGWRLAP